MGKKQKLRIELFLFLVLSGPLNGQALYLPEHEEILGKGSYLFSGTVPDGKYRLEIYQHYAELRDRKKNFLIKTFRSSVPLKDVRYQKEIVYFQMENGQWLEWNLLSDVFKETSNLEKTAVLIDIRKEPKETEKYLLAATPSSLVRAKNGVVLLKKKEVLGSILYQSKVSGQLKHAAPRLESPSRLFFPSQNRRVEIGFLLPGDRKIQKVWSQGLELDEGFLVFSPSLEAWGELLRPEKWKKNKEKGTLKVLISFYPQEAGFWYTLGKQYLEDKEYGPAEESLKKALNLEPSDEIRETLGILYFYQKKYDEAEEILKHSRTATSQFYRANIFYLKKKYPTALYFYRQAVRIDPSFYRAYNNMALIYRLQKNFSRAEEVLLAGIEKNPENADLFYNLGIVMEDRKKTILSILAYEKAYDLKPSYLEAVNRLYYLYMKLDMEEQALVLLKKVLKAYPQNAVSHYNIALIYEKRKNYPLAVFHFNAFLSFSNDAALKKKVEYQLKSVLEKIEKQNGG